MKRDIKFKLVKEIINVVKDGIVVLEKLPKRFQDRAAPNLFKSGCYNKN